MLITVSFPPTENGLLAWSLNFKNLITASPTTYGLTTGDATAYGLVHTAYADALAACEPSVRNKTAVATKNVAKTTLKTQATLLANAIYGTPTVTVPQKVELGIPPRATPAPIPAPASAPAIEILSLSGWTVKIRLKDTASGATRGKPPGVIGASVFTYVGATPPADVSQWMFEGNTGRVTVNVAFNTTVAAGAKVWITAFWFNNRKQSGPVAIAASVRVDEIGNEAPGQPLAEAA